MKTNNVTYHINTLKNSYDHFNRCQGEIWQNTTLFSDKNYKPTCNKCVKTVFYGLNKDKLINERQEARSRLTCV